MYASFNRDRAGRPGIRPPPTRTGANLHTQRLGASCGWTRGSWSLLAALAALAVLLVACRGEAPAPVHAVETPRWGGGATDWVPADASAWVTVDLRGLRAIPELAQLLPAEGSGLDGVSRAVVRAEELVFYWRGALFTERVAVLRGPIDRDALLDALRSSANFTGSSFELITSGTQRVWKSRAGDWTVADPWPDLVLAGDLSAVLDRLGTPPTPGSGAREGSGERALARGLVRVEPVHRQLLLQSERLRPVAALLEPIEQIEIALMDEADPRLTLRVPVGTDADTGALIAIFEALLAEALAPPDDGRARAQPGFASRVEVDGDRRVVISEVVIPRGQLVSIGRLLAAEGARTPPTPAGIPQPEQAVDASGAPTP